MSAVELNRSRTFDTNWLNQSEGTTTWIVTLPAPATTPGSGPLSDAGLPTKGTQHPNDVPSATAQCKLESYSTPEQMDAAGLVWKVVAKYSNYHSFNLVPGFYSRESTIALGTVEIPYGVLMPVQWPTGSATPAIAYIYKIERLKRERKSFVVVIKTWTASYTKNDEKTVANEVGKYHFFDNNGGAGYPPYPQSIPYKFHGAQVSHQRGSVYQLIYTWSVEENVAFIDTANAIAGYTPPTEGGIGTAQSPRIVFPGAQGANGPVLYSYQRFLVIPSPPLVTSAGTGPFYQLPPSFRSVTPFSPSDVRILGVNVSLPGNPQNVT